MTELLRLFTQIALSRKGPQDLPASPLLLGLTVLGYFLVNYVVNLLMPAVDAWRLHLLVDVAFTLAWYSILLRAFGKPERFLQTATAIFGYQIVIAPLWIAAAYFLRRYTDNEVLQLPAALIGLALLFWVIRAGGYILKAALELPMIACVVLIILQGLAGQLVLRAMLPMEANPLSEPATVQPEKKT
ncbi:MAG TPA: hypothetical protein VFS52_14955 [Steroidobacteraceae bacterium]|jgi:hypothetical protein|nr:hypothetical protein [Steroidobacteraceae bacterium]